MPIHLSSSNRRNFLAFSGAASCTALSSQLVAEDANDAILRSKRFVLLSDTHIPSTRDLRWRGAHMAGNLQRVVEDVIEKAEPGTDVIVNGDCAFLKGLPDDYKNLAQLLEPIVDAGMNLHLTMGNHDDRGPCFQAFAAQRSDRRPVAEKHVTVLPMRHANLFLLDSLQFVDNVTGELGESQLTWLAESLDASREKPAILIGHHNLQPDAADGRKITGLSDTRALLEIAESRPWVRAYIYGHTHTWQSTRHSETLTLFNLPPVAYVFKAGRPSGWVAATLTKEKLTLEIHTIDRSHPECGQQRTCDLA